MLRPMFVEFHKDRACEVLDKQYMLGSSLLAAPVFKESGEVEYYVPEGTWINLITGKTVVGGSWKKEVHDYFSLPLLVRPNTILAMGKDETKTSYDFTDQVTFCLSAFTEGGEAKTVVTDEKGNVVMEASAHRAGDIITLTVKGGRGNWSYRLLGERAEALEVVIKAE